MGFPDKQILSPDNAKSTASALREAYDLTRTKALRVAEEIRIFNYNELKKKEYYKHKFVSYKSLSAARISDMFHQSFEVDKPTLEMVEELRRQQAIAATTVNALFEQCKQQAIRHASAAFNLASLAQHPGADAAEAYACATTQQIVGLIVVESIDILVDEIQAISREGRCVSYAEWGHNSQQIATRLGTRLSGRLAERQIIARARELGGISCMLNVIPQILTSLLLKIPAFTLTLIRECTFSTVRCVRTLASQQFPGLEPVRVMLSGTASSLFGIHISRTIGNTLSGVPLNKYNYQVTEVLTGLTVTAASLSAVHTLEQNIGKFSFTTASLRTRKVPHPFEPVA